MLLGGGHASAQVPDRFTNLQVLPKDISKKELIRHMFDFADGLGVECGHCHAGGNPDTLVGVDFASDAKWEKRTARAMLRMVQAVNDDFVTHLEPQPVPQGSPSPPAIRVNCATCHRGVTRPETLKDILTRALAEGGPEAVARQYTELRSHYLVRGVYDFSDRTLNGFAEHFLHEGRTKDAMLLLDLNAQYNPESSWLHYLLGEGRLAQGDKPAALGEYEKAVALDPENSSARKRIGELKGSSKP
jgi:tetratricopeptide (TPR) repeat protein